MAIPNTVQVGGIIAPGAVVDTYPVTDPRYGLGGLRTVDSYSDLALIPNARRQEGMVVYVSGGPTPAYYSYVNSNWILFNNDTTVVTNSASWQSVYTSVNTNSGSWDNAYNTGTVYQTNSASYATVSFANNKFLPLSGGTIDNSGANEIVLRVQGGNDKLAIGTASYTGGGVTLSSVNVSEDKLSTFNIVASAFNVKTADGRTTLVVDKNGKLTIGDSNYFPYTLPEIDGNNKQILVTDGNGNLYWRDASFTISDVAAASGNWDSTFTTVQSLSDSWEESAEIIPTVTNYLSTNNVTLLSATIIDSLSASSIYSSSNVGIIADNTQEQGFGDNTLTLAFLSGVFVKDNLTVKGTLSTSSIYSSSNTGVISDNTNEYGYGDNTLTLAFLSGIYVKNNLTVTNLISTYKYGTSKDWNNAYTNLVANSALYLLSGTDVYLGDLPVLSASWNDAYTNLVNNSAAYLSGFDMSAVIAASGSWNSVYTSVNNTSGSWDSVYTLVNALSDSWEESAEIIPTVTNYLSTNNVILSSATILDYISAATIYSDGSAGIISDDINTTGYGNNTLTLAFLSGTFVKNNLTVTNLISTGNYGTSIDWNSTFTTVGANSANWSNWSTVSGEYTTLNYLSTNNVLLSSAFITDNLTVGLISVSSSATGTEDLTGLYRMTNEIINGYPVFRNIYNKSFIARSGGPDAWYLYLNSVVGSPPNPVYFNTTTSSPWIDEWYTIPGRPNPRPKVSIFNPYLNSLGTITVLNQGNSNQWNSVYTSVNNTSANWDTAYNNSLALIDDINNVAATSAYWADTRYNNTFQGDVSVGGTLKVTGSAVFANTIFTTTSALSVVNTGPGPALYVFQAAGPYDVASFYDGDGVEVLHIGNAQGGGNPLGKVGINTSYPGAELTVNGAISSNNTITVLNGNSNQWNSVYTSVNNTSANWDTAYNNSLALIDDINNVATASAKWESNYTSFNTNSGNYDSVFTTVKSLSDSWEESAEILPTVITYLSSNRVTLSSAAIIDYLSAGTIYSDGTAGIISDNINEAGFGPNTLTLAFQNGIYVKDDLTVTGYISADTFYSDGSAGIISDNINEAGFGLNTLTLAFQNGTYVKDDLTVTGFVSADTFLSDGSAGIISDNKNETGFGLNTLTLAFLSGVYVRNNLTVLNLISTGNHLTSKEWSGTLNVDVLAANNTSLDALSTRIFVKNITEQNSFTYNNFIPGQTINLYLSASHSDVLQHYFPANTYFSSNGMSNLLYTFQNCITRASITNIGNYYLGTTTVINTSTPQYLDLGDYLLVNPLGYIFQENNDRILLE